MKLMQFFVFFYAVRLTQACGSSIKKVKLVEQFQGTPNWKIWEIPPYNDDWWGFVNLLGTREVAQESTTGVAKVTETIDVEHEPGFPKRWRGIGNGYTGAEPPEWARLKENVGQPAICFQPPDKGNGSEWHLRWYYDTRRAKCRRFVYSGLSGNSNRFISNKTCAETCVQPMKCMPCVPERLFDFELFLEPNRRFVLVH
ncbi:unnamed protein product [Parnassius mnemosyne]|uniref:BPTI/Kunitz inhibitor domain-containing protein n=1 Tax=Parnassius mnemosyne TaxID=213953 RepID=A0AAV1KSY4_9NEOP